ncbi:MAG: DUF2612 domain-containing protein [Pyramidobacter sp.]|nr:DUF2612 domain-containing protein [Pyramidobacter sp.]
MTLEEYLDLITSQHCSREKYKKVVTAAVNPYAVTIQTLEEQIALAWDLDTAEGVQLDQVGEWIGRARSLSALLDHNYLTWEERVKTYRMWDEGYWRGRYDPVTGQVKLPDDIYRLLLFAKIASNMWDGTMDTMTQIWNDAFGDFARLFFIDYQDMSIDLCLVGFQQSLYLNVILKEGLIPMKPEGVRVRNYRMYPDRDQKVFAWSRDTDVMGGWGVGAWPENIMTEE